MVSEYTHQSQIRLLEEWNHPFIDYVRRHKRILPVVDLGIRF